MQKKLLLVFIMMATWIVVSCTPTGTGCYGYWESNRWGLKRGTIPNKNANYKNLIENIGGFILFKIYDLHTQYPEGSK